MSRLLAWIGPRLYIPPNATELRGHRSQPLRVEAIDVPANFVVSCRNEAAGQTHDLGFSTSRHQPPLSQHEPTGQRRQKDEAQLKIQHTAIFGEDARFLSS